MIGYYSLIAVLITVLTLTACGGSSSESPPPFDLDPTFSGATQFTVTEGSTSIAGVVASDPEGKAISYALVNGQDSAFFSISSQGQLSFIETPDYEVPFNEGGNNNYFFTVKASDGAKSASLDISVIVTDALEGRVIDGPLSGAEVFLDLDGDFELDPDEPQTISDDMGYFFLNDSEIFCAESNQCQTNVIAYGGVDTSTGIQLDRLLLIAQPQRNKDFVITPLSTLLAGATVPANVINSFGLSVSGEELSMVDPWQLAKNSDGSLLAINQQLGLVFQTLNTLLALTESVSSIQMTLKLIVVVADLAETGIINLGDEFVVADIINTTLSQFPSITILDSQSISLVAAKVAMVNRIINESQTDLTESFAVAVVRAAQSDLQSAISGLNSSQISVEEFLRAASSGTLFTDVPANIDLVDTDGDGLPDILDEDDDNDLVADERDALPLDGSETLDTDGDEVGNNADPDDDNDSFVDSNDAFPLVATEWLDTDGDEIGNNADLDDDNDLVIDNDDAFPLDATETVDTDGDEVGNNADLDDDNDLVIDDDDAFPLDATETVDTDGDEVGNNADPDDDNDSYVDSNDAFPLNATEWLDTDGDGIGNNTDPDDDNDSYFDSNDAFPLVATEWLDTDGDGIGNNTDPDDDNDLVVDDDDAFPLDATETVDTDSDEVGNNADLDDDGDGVIDSRDDAPLDASITPPTALFYADQLQGSAPLIVSFNASDTIPGYLDDTVVSYSWNFGDESSDFGIIVSHTFEEASSFRVVLTVQNSDGLTDTFAETVKVSPGSFSVSGVITVSESMRVDSDVNDLGSSRAINSSFNLAQPLDIPTNVIGYVNTANYGSNGKSFSTGDPRDYYQFDALGGEIINLIMDSPGSTAEGYTDLDMYLYDSNFDLVGYSISSTQYESLMIPLAVGTYYLRVNVWDEGAGKYYLSVSADNTSVGSGWSSDSEFAIGDIIVQERTSKTRAARNIAISTGGPTSVRSMSREGPKLYRYGMTIGQQSTRSFKGLQTNRLTVPSDAEMRVATLLAAKELSMNPAVEYAEPNFLRRSTQVPIDERYGTQWHYDQIRLPEAWDITTGSTDVKVAVIDTGIFVAHPDLAARLSDDGFDFINNAYNAGDGEEVNEDTNGNGVLDPGEDIDGDNYLDDGQEIDNDADDPGDGYENPYCGDGDYSSSFHGTHVAGTVGAETNNDDDSEDVNENGILDLGEDIDSDGILDTAGDGSGNGVAGVTWAGEIMNLRVLGCAGGYDFDIANAIRYAAGLENQSGIIVEDPADIANMSLGGGGTSSTMSNAIADATVAGLIIVAAAGNSATELPSYPAAYTNVISVSATLTDDSLASYSNYGATVDLAAPGSKIKSTLAEYNANEQKIKASYASSNGTSMAAPHVAGVASLMKSVYPDMSPSDFDAILVSGKITIDLGDPGRDDLFGVGRIDAAKAVAFSKDIADGLEVIPVTPILVIGETYLNFGKTIGQYSISASNAGNGNLEIITVTAADPFVIISEPVQQNEISIYTIGINRTGLVDGVYSSTASFSSNGGIVDVSLVFEVMSTNVASEGNLGNISVVLREVDTGIETPLEIQSASEGQYSYSIDGIEAGVYEIHSGTDIDNDGIICGIAEACGAYPIALSPATVVVDRDVSNRNFSLDINTSVYSE